MTDNPIFDSIVRHGRQDADGVRHVWQELTGIFHHQTAVTPAAQPGRQTKMSTLTEIAARLRADAEARIAGGKEYLEQHAQVIEEFAAGLDSNPLMAAAPNLVHLPVEVLSGVANALLDAESKAAAAHQAAADAQAAQDAALAAAQPPADPSVDAPAEAEPGPAQ